MFAAGTYDVRRHWTLAMSELLPQDTHLKVFVGRSAELRQMVAGLERALGGKAGMFRPNLLDLLDEAIVNCRCWTCLVLISP